MTPRTETFYRSAGEIAQDLDTAVVATLPEVPPTCRRDEPDELERFAGAEVLEPIIRSLRASTKSVHVAGVAGDVGRDAIVLSLARTLAETGRRILVVDADVDGPPLAEAESPGLTDILSGETTLSRVVVPSPGYEGMMAFLPVGTTPPLLETPGAVGPIVRVLEDLRPSYDVILVSAPCLDRRGKVHPIATACEVVLLVLSPGILSRDRIRRNFLQLWGVEAPIEGLVTLGVPKVVAEVLAERTGAAPAIAPGAVAAAAGAAIEPNGEAPVVSRPEHPEPPGPAGRPDASEASEASNASEASDAPDVPEVPEPGLPTPPVGADEGSEAPRETPGDLAAPPVDADEDAPAGASPEGPAIPEAEDGAAGRAPFAPEAFDAPGDSFDPAGALDDAPEPSEVADALKAHTSEAFPPGESEEVPASGVFQFLDSLPHDPVTEPAESVHLDLPDVTDEGAPPSDLPAFSAAELPPEDDEIGGDEPEQPSLGFGRQGDGARGDTDLDLDLDLDLDEEKAETLGEIERIAFEAVSDQRGGLRAPRASRAPVVVGAVIGAAAVLVVAFGLVPRLIRGGEPAGLAPVVIQRDENATSAGALGDESFLTVENMAPERADDAAAGDPTGTAGATPPVSEEPTPGRVEPSERVRPAAKAEVERGAPSPPKPLEQAPEPVDSASDRSVRALGGAKGAPTMKSARFGGEAFFAVHITSFRAEDRAANDAERLAKITGHTADFIEYDMPGVGERSGRWYRVIVGRFSDLEAARREASAFVERGITHYARAFYVTGP